MDPYVYLELAAGTSPGAYAYIEPGVFEVIEATIQSYLAGYEFVVVQNPLYIAGQQDISFYIGGYTAGHNTLISEALRAFILGAEGTHKIVSWRQFLDTELSNHLKCFFSRQTPSLL